MALDKPPRDKAIRREQVRCKDKAMRIQLKGGPFDGATVDVSDDRSPRKFFGGMIPGYTQADANGIKGDPTDWAIYVMAGGAYHHLTIPSEVKHGA